MSESPTPAGPAAAPEPTRGQRVETELARPRWWVASTYFAEGFPYSVVHSLAEVLFKEAGASLGAIGLTSLFHLPWNLKFLWGPLLDRFGTKRQWLILTELILGGLMVALALSATLPTVLVVSSVLFTLVAVASATHDIAIDGYYLEALDEKEQSRWVGFRATAYKLAMLLVGGPIIALIGTVGWTAGLGVTAAIMAGLWAYHRRYLPRVEVAERSLGELVRAATTPRVLVGSLALVALIIAGRALIATGPFQDAVAGAVSMQPWLAKVSLAGWVSLALLSALLLMLGLLGPIRRRLSRGDSFYASAFVDFLEQAQIHRILAFIILFRTGESFLVKMRYPFLRDLGMTMAEYGMASGTIGLVFSFVGTIVAGRLIARDGLRRWLWPLVLFQNVPNLAFMALAWAYPLGALARPDFATLTAVISIESFGSGCGTAVFMVYLMRCCRPRFKAAHMAIVTALMSVSFTLAGVMSGFLAELLGFSHYFGLSFLASIPGMAILPFVPYLDGSSAAHPNGPAPDGD